MSEISLYRKWRPQIFGEVVNQNHIKQTLIGALKSNRISHAYLFAGPKGTGKTTVARLLAKAVNCQAKLKNSKTHKSHEHDVEPCNQCDSCQEIIEGRSLDIIEIDAASHRGIDQIRELIEKIKFAPAKAQYKVFVIDEVHMLTREAFNALLKTLEEPPSHSIFILATTEAYKIPPTILSRCQRFDFRKISVPDIKKQLVKVSQKENLKITDNGLDLISENADGSLRDAFGFLDQLRALADKNISTEDAEFILGMAPRKLILKFLGTIFDQNSKKAIETIDEIVTAGFDLGQFIKQTIEILRKIMLVKSGINIEKIGLEEKEAQMIEIWLKNLTLKQILKTIQVFAKAEKDLKEFQPSQIALELTVAELISEPKPANNLTIKTQPEKNPKDLQISNQGFSQTKTEKDILKKWPLVLAEIKNQNGSLFAFLNHCLPINLKNDKIILGAHFKFYKEKIEAKKEIIENAIKKVFQKKYQIVCQKVTQINQKYLENQKHFQKSADKNHQDLAEEAKKIFNGE